VTRGTHKDQRGPSPVPLYASASAPDPALEDYEHCSYPLGAKEWESLSIREVAWTR
jgi:hypothetical protein